MLHFGRQPAEHIDRSEILGATCQRCGVSVRLPRGEARPPSKKLSLFGEGLLGELHQAGCPGCGVRLYLRPVHAMMRVGNRV